ncbi:MAG: Digeranylgeranylglycerophospholipid reductase [Candidatus Heimdallarchaeota archaeon LC_3]|nr:MAG: Digeranylgeranylglycerophospholipid reductase [Candidatus Heimdallarchaeota archaeon LC_3]
MIFLTTECDVLVVGGGPAGVISAYTAAKLGKYVILTDAKSMDQIGNKTCGDAIDLRAPTLIKDKLGLELPHGDEISDIIERLVIQTENQEVDVFGDGFVVDRHIYGKRLLNQAISVGTEVRPHMNAKKSLVDGDWVVGAEFKNKENNKTEQIKAKVTIDCSGRNFVIRKTLPHEKFPLLELEMKPDEICASYREIIKLKEEDHNYHKAIYLIYNNLVPEPGYYWIFSKGPYELNLGIGWKLSNPNKGANMRNIYNKVTHKFFKPEDYEILQAGGYTIPTRYPLFNAVTNGFLTAGDAAFHVDPFTAEGHGPALMAGYYAGKQAVEAIENGKPSTEALWEYNKNCMEAFGTLHCKTQLFEETLAAVKMKGLDYVLRRKVLTVEDFSRINSGEGISTSSLLWKVMRASPRYLLMLKFRKLAKGTKKVEELMKQFPTTSAGYNAWHSKFVPWFTSYMKSF